MPKRKDSRNEDVFHGMKLFLDAELYHALSCIRLRYDNANFTWISKCTDVRTQESNGMNLRIEALPATKMFWLVEQHPPFSAHVLR